MRRPHLLRLRRWLPVRAGARRPRSAAPQRSWGSSASARRSSASAAAAEYDWYSNYGNLANTNALSQGLKPPLRIDWIRRYEGTVKHLPVCGGGRLYTHTAEGQVFAVEQSQAGCCGGVTTLTFTSPSPRRCTSHERLLLPQAGMTQSRLRCLDAATGEMLWEVPFSGSPSWSRQAPPVVCKNLAIYGFGSGPLRGPGHGHALRDERHARACTRWRRDHELDLHARQPLLSERQSPAAVRMGRHHGQGGVAKDFSSTAAAATTAAYA